jgi:hypothetical protein
VESTKSNIDYAFAELNDEAKHAAHSFDFAIVENYARAFSASEAVDPITAQSNSLSLVRVLILQSFDASSIEEKTKHPSSW